jgi:hypothetical protein
LTGERVFISDVVKLGNRAIIAVISVVVRCTRLCNNKGGRARIIRVSFPDEFINKLLLLDCWNWLAEKLWAASTCFAKNEIYDFLLFANRQQEEESGGHG